MLHNYRLSQELAERLSAVQPGIKTVALPPDWFLRLLEPATRDFAALTGLQFPERAAS